MTPSWTWRIPLGEGQKAYYGAETFREEGTVSRCSGGLRPLVQLCVEPAVVSG